MSEQAEVAFDVTPMQNAHRRRGIGRYVAGLARRLLAQREVPIEFWGWNDPPPLQLPEPHRGLWLPRAGMPRSRYPWLFGPIGIRLHAFRSDVRTVHITDPRALVLLRGRRMLTTVYDLIPMLDPDAGGAQLERRAYRRYLQRLPKVDRIFAISQATASDLVEALHIAASRIALAIPGIDELAGADGRPGPGPYFLYIGTPEPHKNLGVVLQAMAIAADLPERLVIAGTWYPEHAEQLRRDAGPVRQRIDLRGFVVDAELQSLIAGATAVIVPSLREGFGLPVAEGFAAQGVVIHSRIPVLMEVSQGAALTFDPSSPTELAACLRRLSGDPRERDRLRALGQQRLSLLTWDGAVNATLRVYRETLGAGAPRPVRP